MVVLELAESLLRKGHTVTLTEDREGKITLQVPPVGAGVLVIPTSIEGDLPAPPEPVAVGATSQPRKKSTSAAKKTGGKRKRKARRHRKKAKAVTQEHVNEMKSLKKKGKTHPQIAKTTGWSLQTVKRYV